MQILEIDLRKIKSTIIVTYCGRSGSYLLSNLLDGHSQILSCPPHSLHDLAEKVFNKLQDYAKNSKGFIIAEFSDWIIKSQPYLFEDSQSADSGLEAGHKMRTGVKKNRFRQIAIELLTSHNRRYQGHLTVADTFSLIHWAYAIAQDRVIDTDTPIICWQRHSFVYHKNIEFIANSTKNPIFITTIRQFEDALDSHFVEMKGQFPTDHERIEILVSQFGHNLAKKPFTSGQYAIKFEDMHLNTERLIRKLSALLDIDFEPTLLETTLDKTPFLFQKGNKLITGTNKNLKRKEFFDVLTKQDITFMSILFRRFYHHYRYEPPSTPLADLIYSSDEIISDVELNTYLTSIKRLGGSPLADRMSAKGSRINLTTLVRHALHTAPLDLIS